MTEGLDESHAAEQARPELPVRAAGADRLFGAYSVLSPGLEIVLEGRPVSAPADD